MPTMENGSPARGEVYWHIATGAVNSAVWDGDKVDLQRQEAGNVFWSPREARAHLDGVPYIGPGDPIPTYERAKQLHQMMRLVDFKGCDGGWHRARRIGVGIEDREFRVAPVVEAHLELPEPMRRAPAIGADVWFIARGGRVKWDGSEWAFAQLRAGLVHASQEGYLATLAAIGSALAFTSEG